MSTASLHTVVRYVHRIAEQCPGGLTDRQLLERFRLHEDESAFAELLRRKHPIFGSCEQSEGREQ